jgi:hypothetical protein
MATIGDYIQPLFPGFPAEGTLEIQRALPVGSPGVRDALGHTPARDLEDLSDDDWLVVKAPIGNLSDPAFEGVFDDNFSGTALSGQWIVMTGVPTVSDGKLHLSNVAPTAQIANERTEVFAGLSFTGYGWQDQYGGFLRVQNTTSTPTYLRFFRGSSNLYTDVSDSGGNVQQVFSYDSSKPHRRISATNGQVRFEHSADGQSWVSLRTITAPSWVASAEASYRVGANASSAGVVTVDRVTLA